jgi:hypothetical protein
MIETHSSNVLRAVPRKVLPFVPRDTSGGYLWHCHERGCTARVYGRYESAAAAQVARHWTDTHDPRDAA